MAILVIGAGKSGIAVSRFLALKGKRVELTDIKGYKELEAELSCLNDLPVKFSMGFYPPVEQGKYKLIVLSPGVPPDILPVRQAKALQIPVIGELELAYRFARSPIVAITGTNGKTTTTSLVGQIFKDAGINTLVAGNIGLPLISKVECYGENDLIVAELSSFQLETIDTFKPCVGAILNITPDHLDRHHTLESYIMAKARLFANQDQKDYSILNYDDPHAKKLAGLCKGKLIYFSRKHTLSSGVFVQQGWIVLRQDFKTVPVLPVKELKIPGSHNLENVLAAVACGWVMHVKPEVLAGTLSNFKGVVHRLEFVEEIDGVKYINDSKGTNPQACIKALKSYDRPVVLIAGGKNKGNDFTELARTIKEKVRALILLGESAGEIEAKARKSGVKVILRAKHLEDSVNLAREIAQSGDIVLLSPACASFDMFKSYEERGDLFKEIVKGIKRREG